VSSLDDVFADHGVQVRPLRLAITLLSHGWQQFDELIRATAAPRRSVQELFEALGDDLERDGHAARIRPGADYSRYCVTAQAEPLDAEIAGRADLLETLTKYIADVPPAMAALDHVQATPETVLRRALWLDARYDLRTARLLFLGDHDLTSLAVRALRPEADLTVLDLDERVLEYVDKVSGRTIRTVHADLRVGLPPLLLGSADLVFSDPPYTPEGMGLFASRGIQALREATKGRILLAYGYSPRHPALGAQVQRELATSGLTFEAIIPDFHRFTGAQAIGSSADLYVCQPTAKAKKSRGAKGKSTIYTHGPQSVESGDTKPDLVEQLDEIAAETGLTVEMRPADWSVPAASGQAVAIDLSADPGPWLLRVLLATNARRVAVLLPNAHPDLGNAEAQAALIALVREKYTLRLLRSTPGNKHAVVVADAVENPRDLLTKAHAKLGNVDEAVPGDLLGYRLIDLPRHRLAELLLQEQF
jgi:predicted methyltransferase